jgi:hypothetical protein
MSYRNKLSYAVLYKKFECIDCRELIPHLACEARVLLPQSARAIVQRINWNISLNICRIHLKVIAKTLTQGI